MPNFAEELDSAIAREDGLKVAKLISITHSDPVEHSNLTNGAMVDKDIRKKFRDVLWGEIAVAHWRVTIQVVQKQDLLEAYSAQNMLLITTNRAAERTDNWILPVLCTIAKELRQLAILADDSSGRLKSKNKSAAAADDDGGSDGTKLEEAARTINRTFTLCLNDRNLEMEVNKKWGVYFFVGELIKIYFKLNKKPLAKNVIKVVQSVNKDLPILSEYPKSHQVTYLYYYGILLFFDEDYARSQEILTQAWEKCYNKPSSKKNQELILLYLIPCKLITTEQTPAKALWDRFPRLAALYQRLTQCVKLGDVSTLDHIISQPSHKRLLIQKYLRLSMDKIRLLAIKNLFFQVYKHGGLNTKIPTAKFASALQLVKFFVDENDTDGNLDHVEGLVAAFISRGDMKGYISHERRTVVLSNKDPFPGRRSSAY